MKRSGIHGRSNSADGPPPARARIWSRSRSAAAHHPPPSHAAGAGNLEAEDALAQVLVDRGADAGEDAAAEHVEQALEEEQGEDDGREADQVGMLRLGRTRS